MTKEQIDEKIFKICKYLREQDIYGKEEYALIDQMNKLIKLYNSI